MNTKNKTISMEIRKIGQVDMVARARGVSFSEVIDYALVRYFQTCSELTAAERFLYREELINLKLDGLLSVFSSTCLKGVFDKFSTCLYLCTGFLGHKKDKIRRELMESSIFEVLNLIKEWDKNVFDKCLTEMDKTGRIKGRYVKKYPQNANSTQGLVSTIMNGNNDNVIIVSDKPIVK